MIKPKALEIIDIDGVERKFIITRFPATVGMEILYRLPTSGVPNIGDFEALKVVRDDIFKYIYVTTDGGDIALTTHALIDNHVGDAETAVKIMGAILTYNYSFLGKIVSGGFLESVTAKIPAIASKLLIQFKDALSEKSSLRSKK